MEVLEMGEEVLDHNKVQYHVTFKIDYAREELVDNKLQMVVPYSEENGLLSSQKLSTEPDILIPSKAFCDLFPYHILFNDSMTIKQCGTFLSRMSHSVISPGEKLFDVIQLSHPCMQLTFQHILKFINAVFMLEIKDMRNGSKITVQSLILKGKIHYYLYLVYF